MRVSVGEIVHERERESLCVCVRECVCASVCVSVIKSVVGTD